MSRSGYSDEGDNIELWRGAVANALRGKRGQAFLREMIAALDALSEKKLCTSYLVDGPNVCALGAVGLRRGIDMKPADATSDDLATMFGIARAMAAEITYLNDEAYWDVTPERRWQIMRDWAKKNIKEDNN